MSSPRLPRRIRPLPRRAGAAAAVVVILGVMHLALDGLTAVLVPLQAVVADRTGATPAALGLLVALALASASLLQPVTAVAATRWGEGRVAAAGALLAAIGYGSLPAAASIVQAAAAVVVGGLGSAMFHPGAGALIARAAPPGREALPLAVFSAVGTAGAAVVPLAVLSGMSTLGAAAALPVAVAVAVAAVALSVGLLLSRAARATGHSHRARRGTSPRTLGDERAVLVPIGVGALITLVGVSVTATAPLLLARTLEPTDPLLGVAVAAYSAAGAVGGIALALWTRRAPIRTVLLVAVTVGLAAALLLPQVSTGAVPLVMLAAGVGLSGTLPLLVATARRPSEASAAPAVGRILGLATGLGGVGYAGIGLLQTAVGYTQALTATAVVAGAGALLLITRLHTTGADPDTTLRAALQACGCGSCAVSGCRCAPHACTCGSPSTSDRLPVDTRRG